MRLAPIVTCEHAGNRVPPRYAWLFQNQQLLLRSHRGYDPGALALARHLARQLQVPLQAATVTRLLVELNRSPGHKQLFSEFSAALDATARQCVLEEHYFPHRQRVQESVEAVGRGGAAALHIAVHTFTPYLQGQVRNADIGLLYDPARSAEKAFCHRWRRELGSHRGDLCVRRNYPYRGKADGLTTFLRRRFPAYTYLGIELEVNQKWLADTAAWKELQRAVAGSLVAALDAFSA